MKINLKIILPIYLLLAIILISFGYLLFYLNLESSNISKSTETFRNLNQLSQSLRKEQEITEYNMIVYTLHEDPKALDNIAQSEINKAKIVDQMYPLITDETGRKLIDEYINSRRDIFEIRSTLLEAVKSKKQFLIDERYSAWNEKTIQIREAIGNVETYNLSNLNIILEAYKNIGKRIGLIIILLSLFVIFIISGFFYYLRNSITTPLINLVKFTNQLAERNFSLLMDNNLSRDDEIGVLYRSFTNLAKRIKESYHSLEQNVQERTKELMVRTNELEKSQKATLNILEDLSNERKILVETRALDEAILASIGEALVVVDKDGYITYVNEEFEYITGWKPEEVIGKMSTEVLKAETEKGISIPHENRFITKVLNDIAEETDISGSQVYYFRKNESRFPINSVVRKIMIGGKPIGAVKTFRDISRELEIDKAKTEFVSLAAHQLRTPLSAISWYTEMLLSGDAGELGELQKKYLEQIYLGNQRMIGMVKSFLNVSRIDLGNFQMIKAPTNISELMKGVIEEQKRKITEKQIDFSFNFDPKLPLVEIDAERMRMVLQNLLANAIKYTGEQGKIKVHIRRINDKEIEVTFMDTGYGIPANSQSKIFTKLYRAENVIEKATDGTGLGLYIVKNIVDSSGGKIWFESEENKGTTFHLILPI